VYQHLLAIDHSHDVSTAVLMGGAPRRRGTSFVTSFARERSRRGARGGGLRSGQVENHGSSPVRDEREESRPRAALDALPYIVVDLSDAMVREGRGGEPIFSVSGTIRRPRPRRGARPELVLAISDRWRPDAPAWRWPARANPGPGHPRSDALRRDVDD